MFYGRSPAQAIAQSGQSSRTTHGAPAAIDACRYFGSLIWNALNGADKATLLASRYSPLADQWQTDPLDPAINEIAAGSFKERQPPEIKGSGYVVKSLEAALWAFYHSDNFRDGCLLAANLGDDADTTAAVYGQLAGAFYGEEAIPAAWRDKLALRSTIQSLADKLFELAQ
jgi:ADP-ribosylglycohydrolase